jgi:hypothetical protein
MCIAADSRRCILALLEYTNFIRYGAFTQFVYSEAQVENLWEREWGKELDQIFTNVYINIRTMRSLGKMTIPPNLSAVTKAA